MKKEIFLRDLDLAFEACLSRRSYVQTIGLYENGAVSLTEAHKPLVEYSEVNFRYYAENQNEKRRVKKLASSLFSHYLRYYTRYFPDVLYTDDLNAAPGIINVRVRYAKNPCQLKFVQAGIKNDQRNCS